MNLKSLYAAFPLVLAFAAASGPAGAVSGMFATEPEAQQACGADEVVWVDLDRGRFYTKSQADYSKSHNGGFTCMKVAHAQYRPGHD
jgi:hypothetical protein